MPSGTGGVCGGASVEHLEGVSQSRVIVSAAWEGA